MSKRRSHRAKIVRDLLEKHESDRVINSGIRELRNLTTPSRHDISNSDKRLLFSLPKDNGKRTSYPRSFGSGRRLLQIAKGLIGWYDDVL